MLWQEMGVLIERRTDVGMPESPCNHQNVHSIFNTSRCEGVTEGKRIKNYIPDPTAVFDSGVFLP